MVSFSRLISYLSCHCVEYKTNSKTADITTVKTGGTAKLIIYPSSLKEFVSIVRRIDTKFAIIGNGSNSMFCDNVFDGVIVVTKKLNKIDVKNNELIAECGASIPKCCRFALEKSLCGLEFAYGIPGTVGGAIYMNASAFGTDFEKIVFESTVYDKNSDRIFTISNYEHEFSTKMSVFQRKNWYILQSKLLLGADIQESIRNKMESYINYRAEHQPLDMPSSGSTFKRPKNGYASELIDKAGLKGYKIGGASVSSKHAGFIINEGNATSNDVLRLIDYIKAEVDKRFNIKLEEEIIYFD